VQTRAGWLPINGGAAARWHNIGLAFAQHSRTLKSFPIARIASALVVSVLLQACGSLPRLDAVPSTLTETAVIPGIPNSRYWLDRDLAPFIQSVIQDDKREREALARAGKATDLLPPANLLAISGGGDAGAFAAGLLADGPHMGLDPSSRSSRALARAA
jgi:hypothetical protein